MLATTGDGHALRLENAELRTLMPQLGHPALKQLVRANYRGNLPEAVKHSVAALSDNAWRIGAVRERQTGSSYPVFVSELGGRTYEILTQPAAGGENSVIGLRALPVRSHAEYMASPRGPTAAATRQTTLGPRQALSTAAADGNNNVEGVYNIYHNGQLVYHGQSQNVRTRLGAHLRCLNELRVPIAGYQAAVGRMAGSTQQQRRGEETRRIDQSRATGRRTGNKQREFEGEAEFDMNTIHRIFEVVKQAAEPVLDIVRRMPGGLSTLSPTEKTTMMNAARYAMTVGSNVANRIAKGFPSPGFAAGVHAIQTGGQPTASSLLRPPPTRRPPERRPSAPPISARRPPVTSPTARTPPRPPSRPPARPSPGMGGSQTRQNRPSPAQRPAPRHVIPPRRPPRRP